MRKSIKKFSDEELVQLTSLSHPDAPENNNDAADFIIAMRFERGHKPMPFGLIHLIYKLWSDRPVNRSVLGRELKKRFNRRRSRYEVFYDMAKAPKRKPGRKY